MLGITGSVAAYKGAELLRQLREHGAEVCVVMTPGASEFITPLTMQALSNGKVYTETSNAGMSHIELARWCDLILVAPASANFIAHLAHGMADNLLHTLCLATTAPIIVAPAMNQQMWLNPATQDNIVILDKRAVKIVGPSSGLQACGEVGPGRMLEPEQLIAASSQMFSTTSLTGLHIMVTAGATREIIDPVRYISNRSSGRMGYALARASIEAGANVTLISGPVVIQPPQRVQHIIVETADQMRDAVMSDIVVHDIFIATAAVTDYKCANIAKQKIKRESDHMELLLERNPDILGEVAGLPQAPFTVGFAAETENLLDNAQLKLQDRRLDMIAANQVGDGIGFDVEENALQIFWRSSDKDIQHLNLQQASKEKLARQLVQVIADRYYAKDSNQIH